MGGNLSTQGLIDNVANFVTGRKRKHSESDDDDLNKVIEIALHTPKKWVVDIVEALYMLSVM